MPRYEGYAGRRECIVPGAFTIESQDILSGHLTCAILTCLITNPYHKWSSLRAGAGPSACGRVCKPWVS